MGIITDILRKELTRAVLERTQSLDLSKMMAMFGAAEPVSYDDVEERLNIAYVNRQEVALAMDLFIPKTAAGKELPVIVDVHGGGLFMGDRGINRPFCRFLAHRGYLVFSLEYRLAPKATIMQQFDDVCAGMDFVGRMLVDFDVDFTRMFLVADSAGAFLATYVAAMHDSEKLQDVIGYKPSRMVYAAVGTISGMFYTNKTLEEQIFGDKLEDPEFRQYMNVEHPEIIRNLPPLFLLTSCGDTFNNYSFRFHEALKRAGKTSKLLYLGDEELMHIFPIVNPEHPRSIETLDKMLAWMEAQADKRRESRKKSPADIRAIQRVEKRIAEGTILNQKLWANLKERISCDSALMERTALVDCTREYTFDQMFQEWERYAKVFSGLEIHGKNQSRVALCAVTAAEPLFALFGLNMTGAEISLFSYSDLLPGGKWKELIEREHITDLVISDILITPQRWEEIKAVRERFGLRHVLLMHSLMGGPVTGPTELVCHEYNYYSLRRLPDTVFIGDLFAQYADEPIRYDRSRGGVTAFLAHAPGTRETVLFTDKAFNRAIQLVADETRNGTEDGRQLSRVPTLAMSDAYGLATGIIGPLARGEKVVMPFFGFMHPKFLKAIEYHRVKAVDVTGLMVEKWITSPETQNIDLSSLKSVVLLGDRISPEKLERYRVFFRDRGCKCNITVSDGATKPDALPCGMGKDGAGNLFDLAAAQSEEDAEEFPDPFVLLEKQLKDKKPENEEFTMPKLPEGVLKEIIKHGNRIMAIPNGRKWIAHDIED